MQKTVLVTGCSSGIGLESALDLKRQGFNVLAACRKAEAMNFVPGADWSEGSAGTNAPGTALALGQTIAAARGQAPHYLSLRAGDVVGEHLVQFTGAGERLELIHRATDRDIFARGALHAAVRIAARAPGNYRLRDLLD